jgi:hypothetical protein
MYIIYIYIYEYIYIYVSIYLSISIYIASERERESDDEAADTAPCRGQGVCVWERERERKIDRESLAHTRWSGGRRYRGRGKWIRGESFVSTRGECLRKRARVYMCTENPGISVESLFLSLSSFCLFLSPLSQKSELSRYCFWMCQQSICWLFVKLYFQISRDPFRSGAARIGSTL